MPSSIWSVFSVRRSSPVPVSDVRSQPDTSSQFLYHMEHIEVDDGQEIDVTLGKENGMDDGQEIVASSAK